MIRNITLVLAVFMSLHTNASSIGDALITRVHLNSNGFAYIKFNKSRSSTCSGSPEFFVIDLSTRFGELQYSHALSIFHAQTKVLVTGNGQCSSPHTIETISDFQTYK